MSETREETLACELSELLKKQTEFLETRSLGGASDSELLEYEVRQEIIKEICDQLSDAGQSQGLSWVAVNRC